MTKGIKAKAERALELSEKATIGPWEHNTCIDMPKAEPWKHGPNLWGQTETIRGFHSCCECVHSDLTDADADFIAESRTLLPELAQALLDVLKNIEELEGK